MLKKSLYRLFKNIFATQEAFCAFFPPWPPAWVFIAGLNKVLPALLMVFYLMDFQAEIRDACVWQPRKFLRTRLTLQSGEQREERPLMSPTQSAVISHYLFFTGSQLCSCSASDNGSDWTRRSRETVRKPMWIMVFSGTFKGSFSLLIINGCHLRISGSSLSTLKRFLRSYGKNKNKIFLIIKGLPCHKITNMSETFSISVLTNLLLTAGQLAKFTLNPAYVKDKAVWKSNHYVWWTMSAKLL